jgi:hypothetical protein
MDLFDKLYSKIMESMVMGGADSIMGNPATGGEIGSHGGEVGNSDFYASGTTVLPKSIFGKIQKRNPIEKTTGKKKNKK